MFVHTTKVIFVRKRKKKKNDHQENFQCSPSHFPLRGGIHNFIHQKMQLGRIQGWKAEAVEQLKHGRG